MKISTSKYETMVVSFSRSFFECSTLTTTYSQVGKLHSKRQTHKLV